MFFLTIWLLLTRVGADDTTTATELIMCDGVVFHGIYYDKEVLFKDLGRPYNLVMHKYSGNLFFSHTIQSGTQVDFGVMSCNLDKKTCSHITGLSGGYAIAYDSGNDDIYFGGHDGIYKYNFSTKGADYFAEEGKSIWSLFIRRNFYYIEYPTQKLYVYKNDKFVKVAEAANIEVDNYYVSKNNNVYFSNKTALYKVEKAQKDSYILTDSVSVRQINEDYFGDIYFCANDGIYMEDRPFRRVIRVADIEQVFGMTFDTQDQVIYSDKDTIYRLVKSKYSQLCLDAIIDADAKGDEQLTNIIIS